MFQSIKDYLQEKIDESGGEANKNIYIGVGAAVLIAVLYFYYQHIVYRTYHKHPIAAKQPAAVAPAPDPVVVTPAYTPPTTPEVAVAPPLETPVSSTNFLNPKKSSGNLSDSWKTLSASPARTETVQAGNPAATTLAVPVARTLLKPKAPAGPLTEEQRLVQAAQDRFDSLADIAAKNPDAFGFTSDDKVETAKLGAPIPVYSIAESDRMKFSDGQSVNSILRNGREWFVPVMMNDRTCFMLPVRRTDDEYTTGKYSRALALAYEKLQQRWPASDGYHPRIVANPNQTGYFFTVPELPQPNLTDTGEMFQPYPKLTPASVILASWR